MARENYVFCQTNRIGFEVTTLTAKGITIMARISLQSVRVAIQHYHLGVYATSDVRVPVGFVVLGKSLSTVDRLVDFLRAE